jgi:hypothetical protein
MAACGCSLILSLSRLRRAAGLLLQPCPHSSIDDLAHDSNHRGAPVQGNMAHLAVERTVNTTHQDVLCVWALVILLEQPAQEYFGSAIWSYGYQIYDCLAGHGFSRFLCVTVDVWQNIK